MQSDKDTVTFSIVEETRELHARFDPAGGIPLTDIAAFKQKVVDAGFGDLYLNEAAINDFMRRCGTTKQPLDLVIGEKRDASYSLRLTDDLMFAYLTLTPPQGGNPVGTAVIDEMREKGIVYGILHSQLDAALAAGKCENLLIAKGDPPQEGVATRFEILFDGKRNQAAKTDDLAVIQLRNISHLLLVHQGDPLMCRYPPLRGTSGTNIKNELVLPRTIEEEFYCSDLPGAAPDPNNPDLLVATAAGQPVSVGNGVKVNPVIEVHDVDMSTGDINFEGTVRVTGDVKSGMHLIVTGDVIVNGAVEAAEIVAGGNVSVSGGVIGHPDTHTAGSRVLPENTARIICQGTVHAFFMESAHVEAGESILIEHGASQCELMARKEIHVGKDDSKKSQLIGGIAQATQLVKTAVLGSSAGGIVQVQVGSDPYLDEAILGRKRLLQRKTDELDRVLKLLSYIKQHPKKDVGGLGEKTEKTCRHLADEIETLTADLSQLEEKRESVELAQVQVSKMIHAGAEIRVGGQVLKLNEDIAGAVIKLQEGEIAIFR